MAEEDEDEFDMEQIVQDQEENLSEFMTAIDQVSQETGNSPQEIIKNVTSARKEQEENEAQVYKQLQNELDLNGGSQDKSMMEHLKEVRMLQELGGGGGFGGGGNDMATMMMGMAKMFEAMQPQQQQQTDPIQAAKTMMEIQNQGSDNEQIVDVMQDMVENERKQRQNLEEQIHQYNQQGSTGDQVKDELIDRLQKMERKLEQVNRGGGGSGIDSLKQEVEDIKEKREQLKEIVDLAGTEEMQDESGDTNWEKVIKQFAGSLGDVAQNMPKGGGNTPSRKNVDQMGGTQSSNTNASSTSSSSDDGAGIVDAQEVMEKVDEKGSSSRSEQSSSGQGEPEEENEQSSSGVGQAVEISGGKAGSPNTAGNGTSQEMEKVEVSSGSDEAEEQSQEMQPDEAAVQQKVENNKIGELRSEASDLGLDTTGTKKELAERIMSAQTA